MPNNNEHLYREMLERWHRCKRQMPGLDHDHLLPKPEDYGFAPGDRRAEEIMFEVKREFARME